MRHSGHKERWGIKEELRTGQERRDELFKNTPRLLFLSAPLASEKGVRNRRLRQRNGLNLATASKDDGV